MTDDAGEDYPNKPHDALFHLAFSRPENAVSELRAVLPAEVFAALDTSALVVEPDHFVEPELSELESDLLFSVPLRGKPAYVYVLVEHQSTPDPLMPWRMLQYLTKVWRRVLEKGPVKRLPVIVPIVVAHVERGWNTPTRFQEVLEIDEPLRGAIGPFVPDFRFLLDDLARVSDEELRGAREATAFARLVWFLLKHGRTSDNLLAGLEEWGRFLGEMVREPAHAEDILSLLVYIRTVTDVPADRLRAFLCEHVGPEMEENMSAVEMMLEANRHKWIAEGKAEGRVEGKAEGEARILLKMLTMRFGAPSEVHRARVAAATTDELERWAERVLTGGSIDDVLS